MQHFYPKKKDLTKIQNRSDHQGTQIMVEIIERLLKINELVPNNRKNARFFKKHIFKSFFNLPQKILKIFKKFQRI